MLNIEFDQENGTLHIEVSDQKCSYITESDNDMNLSFLCNSDDVVIGIILFNINDIVDNFPVGYWDNHPDRNLIPNIILDLLNAAQQKKSSLLRGDK